MKKIILAAAIAAISASVFADSTSVSATGNVSSSITANGVGTMQVGASVGNSATATADSSTTFPAFFAAQNAANTKVVISGGSSTSSAATGSGSVGKADATQATSAAAHADQVGPFGFAPISANSAASLSSTSKTVNNSHILGGSNSNVNSTNLGAQNTSIAAAGGSLFPLATNASGSSIGGASSANVNTSTIFFPLFHTTTSSGTVNQSGNYSAVAP